jgi:hypothetical protein
MAADLTDHVWTLQEVLLFRMPPWPHPQAVEEIDDDDEHNARSDRYACDQVKGGQGGLENPFRKVTTG